MPIKMRGEKVSVFYGAKQALYEVDLNVAERQVTALIGPSGCGKSTFLRTLNRMNDTIEGCRVEGKITLDGDDIYDRDLDVVDLCIARAIAVSPEVILMDEPCSALDPIATATVEELIDELKQNFTIVIVTHSMQQAARVSQSTAMFHLGRIVEVGPTEKMFSNPDDKRTQDYITGRFG